MEKFNSPVTIKTENKSGHVAYGMGDKEKLITQVFTSFVNEAKFYGDNPQKCRNDQAGCKRRFRSMSGETKRKILRGIKLTQEKMRC